MAKKNKEDPDLPIDGGSHYNMSGGRNFTWALCCCGNTRSGVSTRRSGSPKISQCVYLLCCIDIPERFGRFVAAKVQTIDINHLVQSDILEAEFVLLDRIRSVKMAHVHPRKGHVVHILDQFQLNGSSGVHTCLNFPVVGPSLSAYLYASGSKKVDYMLVSKTAPSGFGLSSR